MVGLAPEFKRDLEVWRAWLPALPDIPSLQISAITATATASASTAYLGVSRLEHEPDNETRQWAGQKAREYEKLQTEAQRSTAIHAMLQRLDAKTADEFEGADQGYRSALAGTMRHHAAAMQLAPSSSTSRARC